jgi:hypothetical protein
MIKLALLLLIFDFVLSQNYRYQITDNFQLIPSIIKSDSISDFHIAGNQTFLLHSSSGTTKLVSRYEP